MSQASVSEFVAACDTDTHLQEQLAAASSLEEFVNIAESLGYGFSLEELQTQLTAGEPELYDLNLTPGYSQLHTVQPGCACFCSCSCTCSSSCPCSSSCASASSSSCSYAIGIDLTLKSSSEPLDQSAERHP